MVLLSAGLLMYRMDAGELQVLLVHPGGPFFVHKDAGVWGIPKGLVDAGEPVLAAARREFEEETSLTVVTDEFLDLGQVRQKSGKIVRAWAFAGDCDADKVHSNTFSMEWPKGSGRQQEFPEIDRAQWFGLARARAVINEPQVVLLDRLERALSR